MGASDRAAPPSQAARRLRCVVGLARDRRRRSRQAEIIETRLDAIEGGIEARAMWRRGDFAMAGCIVTIAQDGSLQVIAGLVKPEDMPKRNESAEAGAETSNGGEADAGVMGAS